MFSIFQDASQRSPILTDRTQAANKRWIESQKDLEKSYFPQTAVTLVDDTDDPSKNSANKTDSNGNPSWKQSMTQLDQAIQGPGELDQIKLNKGLNLQATDRSAQSGSGNVGTAGNAGGARETEQESEQDKDARLKTEAAPQNDSAQKEKQQEEAKANKLFSAAKKGEGDKEGDKNDASSEKAMDMGGANAESPAMALKREIQETRQNLRDDKPDADTPPSGGGMLGGGGSMLGGGGSSGGNAEMILNQAGQKAQVGDQDHKRGTRQTMSGKMQVQKGLGVQKSGEAQCNAGTGMSTAGQALIHSGQALLSNPFTAAIGAAMVSSGTALKVSGTALKATGTATKNAGKGVEEVGQKTEKSGQKLTKKASKHVQIGHQQLQLLRNRQRNGGKSQPKTLASGPGLSARPGAQAQDSQKGSTRMAEGSQKPQAASEPVSTGVPHAIPTTPTPMTA